MPRRDAFLTGATGFIGGALLDRLLASERSVTALVRTPAVAERLARRGVEPVVGDLLDHHSFAAALAGCRTVFHVAGLNAMCLRDPERLDSVNVGGTRAVVRAAADAGVGRVVYTSSAATIGERRGVVATETTPHRGSYNTAYERSKHRAEVAAFEESDRLGVPLVSLNPSSVQGPGRTGGTARILLAFLRGRLRFATDTSMSLVYIGDVIDAHVAAESRGVAGERYLVSGWTTSVAGAVAQMREVTGQDADVRYLPGWLLEVAGALTGGLWRVARRDAPLCREMVRALRHGHTYDGSRASRELGIAYTPPADWFAETIAWYRSEGLIA